MSLLRQGVAIVLGACFALAGVAKAEEGMWTFDNIPAERMRADIGWAPDEAWLERVMASSARLPGCSASLVSGEGLVLTNYHCVDSCVYGLSSARRNYQEDGFRAATREEEARCAGMYLYVLQEISDVTGDIERAASSAAPEAFAGVRDAEITRLERACAESAANVRCEVVTLYQGGRYALYRYKRYDDVRLVFSPEEKAAFFGFDPDNFNFPRYCADFAFLRVYENGASVETPTHLPMRFTPLAEGEATLVSGHPGRTSRLTPTAALAFERDYRIPLRITDYAEWRGRLIAYSERGEEEARLASETLHSVENGFKVYWGRRLALADAQSFARVVAVEDDLKARVARNAAAERELGSAWDEVEAAVARERGLYMYMEYLETRAGHGSQLLDWARDLVRGVAERQLPDAERLPEYSAARLLSIEAQLRADRQVTPEIEEMRLAFWLSKTRERLTVDDPIVQRMLERESPEALAARLVRDTRLGDPDVRARLWAGGAAAIAASNDPLIQFVRRWDDDARTIRARYEREVEGPMAQAEERIAKARFRAFGLDVYPDATFTLRLSYGRIAGWTEPNGREIGPFTDFAGLSARATGMAPYEIEPRWRSALPDMQSDTIFNVSSTHDIIGGNSGSPMLDTEGRVVGVVFDGNIHSLGGNYFYDGELNRTVTLAATAMRAILADVYDMDGLVAELDAAAPSADASESGADAASSS